MKQPKCKFCGRSIDQANDAEAHIRDEDDAWHAVCSLTASWNGDYR